MPQKRKNEAILNNLKYVSLANESLLGTSFDTVETLYTHRVWHKMIEIIGSCRRRETLKRELSHSTDDDNSGDVHGRLSRSDPTRTAYCVRTERTVCHYSETRI